MPSFVAPLVIIIILIVILVKNIIVVQQARAYVIERLGAYSATWTVGIHFKIPLLKGLQR